MHNLLYFYWCYILDKSTTMKRNLNIFLLSVFVAFASCSFTTKTFDDPNKDRLLMQLITYLLEQGHFQPKDFNDALSKDVYKRFLNRVDPFKHYFYKSDLQKFKEFELELDNQIQNYEVQFFDLVHVWCGLCFFCACTGPMWT